MATTTPTHPPTNNPILEPTLPTDTLSIFRSQIGITDISPPDPTKSSKRHRTSPKNIGLYHRVTTAEKNARLQYYATATLINTCLLLQIVFGSVLTALGAANGSHMIITGVGAANTVIAALLSFTKGQGLPNKLMQYQNTMRKVREYIEQRERDFGVPGSWGRLDLEGEVRTIVEMYERARRNDEKSDPDAYVNDLEVSAAKTGKVGVVAVGNAAPLAAPPEDVKSMLGKLAAAAGGHQKQHSEEDLEKAEGLTEHQKDVLHGDANEHSDGATLSQMAKAMLASKHNW